MCIRDSLFANHIFYWGDAHHALTMGPDRANRMDACASAARAGVPFAIHSDAPITPLGPLFTAWCAVNRQTASGRVLGESERISVEAALHAITLGAVSYTHLDVYKRQACSRSTRSWLRILVLQKASVVTGRKCASNLATASRRSPGSIS